MLFLQDDDNEPSSSKKKQTTLKFGGASKKFTKVAGKISALLMRICWTIRQIFPQQGPQQQQKSEGAKVSVVNMHRKSISSLLLPSEFIEFFLIHFAKE